MTDYSAQWQMLAAEFERLAERGVRSAPEMRRMVLDLQREFDNLVHQRQELASLYAVAGDLAAATELPDLLQSIIDKALVLVGAERGFVVLVRPSGEQYIAAARRFAAGEVEATDEAFSSSLINRVLHSREPILTTNVQDDSRYELSQSIIMQNIRSVLAAPLIARAELQGAIYVDTRLSARPFGEAELRLLQAMASQAAMAIRGARLYEDVRESNAQLRAALDELRQTQGQLVQAERLAAVGRLAANVAHELRNPLMVMRNAIYYMERLMGAGKLDSPDVFRRYLGKLDGEIERQNKIINDLLFFSRNRPRQLSVVDLNAILDEALMRVAMPESVKVERNLAEDLETLHADGDQLQQVFINLISNAVQAMPEGGALKVRSWAEGDYALVEVADTGVGIAEASLARLFEPFFTTKEKGIGLGLSVVKGIVEGHRGEITVRSTVGQGTAFTVKLPFELVG